MTTNSAIEWTDHTFNPWWGCTKVSQGCKHCYAETLAKRTGRDVWGPQAQRRRTSPANWREPYKWDKAARAAGTRARVFCASMADLFEDNEQVIPWRKELWEVVAQTPALTWQLLTKRPENIGRMVPLHWSRGEWPSNVWIGTSVEDQATADERIPHLYNIPAAGRFLSIEPLLGPVNLGRWLEFAGSDTDLGIANPGIDWVIVGGESGPHARPMHPAWVRSLRDQCAAAGTPFFFKQWGEWLPGVIEDNDGFINGKCLYIAGYGRTSLARLDGSIAGNTYIFDGTTAANRVGKRTAGRLLDGVEWNEFPLAALRTVDSMEVSRS